MYEEEKSEIDKLLDALEERVSTPKTPEQAPKKEDPYVAPPSKVEEKKRRNNMGFPLVVTNYHSRDTECLYQCPEGYYRREKGSGDNTKTYRGTQSPQ